MDSLKSRVRAYFVAGLLTVTPIGLTIFILWELFGLVDGLLDNVFHWMATHGMQINGLQSPPLGAGFLSVILIIFLAGILARNYFGRQLLRLGEKILERIPVANRLYTALKQIIEIFLSNDQELFRRPVLIEYPRKRVWSVAFVTANGDETLEKVIGEDTISVFLPTTPNPTSGFLLLLPLADVYELDMTVEEALKLVISGGVATPSKIRKIQTVSAEAS